MTSSPLFSDAMRLTAAGAGVYRGALDEHWTIGPKVHGGAMLALCAQAARHEIGDREPIAVSGSFLWAPDPGPMDVVATVRKRGRRVSVVDVELNQGERTAVRAVITMGTPEHPVPPLLSVNPVPAAMSPEPPPDLEAIGPGHPMADVVHLAHGCDIRPLTLPVDAVTGPSLQYWVRPRNEAPDVLFALLCGDVSAPVTYGVNRFGWAPTLQLTAYLRAVPTDGWLRVMCTTTQIGQDWFDEDHLVVDCEGRIVVQTRQLALVPPEQAPDA